MIRQRWDKADPLASFYFIFTPRALNILNKEIIMWQCRMSGFGKLVVVGQMERPEQLWRRPNCDYCRMCGRLQMLWRHTQQRLISILGSSIIMWVHLWMFLYSYVAEQVGIQFQFFHPYFHRTELIVCLHNWSCLVKELYSLLIDWRKLFSLYLSNKWMKMLKSESLIGVMNKYLCVATR